MSVKFIGTTLVIGCLVGALLPLPGRVEKPEGVRSVAVSRSSTSDSRLEPPTQSEVTATSAATAAETDAQAFFHWLLKAEPQPSPEIVEAFFSAWIGRNPDAAFQAALLLPERFGYNMDSQYFPREVQLLFRRDPMAALRWVGRIEGVIGHDITLHMSVDLIEKLRPLDVEQARTWLNRCPVGGVSAGMAQACAAMLAEKDPATAIRWVESLNVEYQNVAMPMMLHHFSKQDPAAAMEYIRNAPSNIKQYCALFATQAGSTETILEQMKWLEEDMGTVSYTGLNNHLSRLYGSSPQAAVDHVIAMEGTTQGMAAVRGLAEAACYSGPTSKAMEMIAKLPDSLQQEASRSAMYVRMPGDFTEFLQPMADGSIKGGELDSYIQLLADFVDGEKGTWAVTGVPEHLDSFQKWILENPGPARDEFIRQAMEKLKETPDVRDKAFENLPEEEMKRILDGR